MNVTLLLPAVAGLHLGALHGHELLLVLAFGPFVLLGVVVVVRGRRDRAEGSPSPAAQRDR